MRKLSLQQLSKEELREMSLIELGYQYLEQNKQALSFNELVEEIANLLGIPMEDMRSRMVQFYTDLNIDGRFISLGDNRWGLRIWYPYDQIDEEVVAPVKTKKKKSKKVVEEEDEDLLDDEDLDYDDLDDLDDFEDEDDLIDDDEEVDDEDFDEDDDEVFEDDEELIGEDDYDLGEDEEDDLDPEEEEEEK